jgi:hypothetical protein
MEVWKDVVGFEGKYKSSNFGNIKSLSRACQRSDGKKGYVNERILKPSIDNKGYLRVKLYDQKLKKTFKVHRLIAECFFNGTIENKEINHIDGNKTNNNVTNLETCNSKENAIHAVVNGLRGNRVKLTVQDVLDIRRNKDICNKILSEKYNVTLSNIQSIKRKASWKHV